MADTKISDLPAASAITGTEVIPVVQGGADKASSPADFRTYILNTTPRVTVIADGTSVTMNCSTTDLATQANTQALGTLTINAPTGSPVNGQKLMLRLRTTNVQTFSWNAIFQGSDDIALPTESSGATKYDYFGFIYNSTATKWQLIAVIRGF